MSDSHQYILQKPTIVMTPTTYTSLICLWSMWKPFPRTDPAHAPTTGAPTGIQSDDTQFKPVGEVAESTRRKLI